MSTPKLEPSTLTRSQSNTGSAQRKDLILGKSSVLDAVFPLIDEMLKFARLPSFFYPLLDVILVTQIACCSFWVQFPGYVEFDTIGGKILRPILFFTFFSDLSRSTTSFTIRFVITTLVVVLYFGMLILQALIFNQQRRFIRWTLYLTRFFIEFLPVICVFPLGNFIGETFHWMCESMSSMAIIYFAFNLIYLGCFLFAHYLESYLFASSVYISNATTSCWDAFFHFHFIIGAALFPVMAYIVMQFADWLRVVLIILKMAFNVLICYETTFLPFIHFHTNTLAAALYTAMIVSDFIALLRYFMTIGMNYQLIALVGTFLVSALIWRRVSNSSVDRVNHNLSRSTIEGIEVTPAATPA
jgi:hypothetical protein